MDKKKSILIYSDFLHKISKLSDEQAGKLFKGLLNYSNGITPEFDDILLDYAFEDIKTTIDRDSEKYLLKCLKNKEIAIERERIKRERNNTNVHERTRIITNSTDRDNDNDNDIDSDKDIDIDNDILLEKETKEKFLESEILIEPLESEKEKRKKVAPKKEKENKPDLDTFIDYARVIYQDELKVDFLPFIFAVTSKFNDWNDSGWNDGNGKPILSWKNKLRNLIPYFKPINNNSYGNTKTPTNQFNSNQKQSRTGRQILAERLINATKANGESGSTIIDVEAL